MQPSLSPKVAEDEANDKAQNRAGVPYCATCKSLVACNVADQQSYAHSGWLTRKKSRFHMKTKRFFVVIGEHVFYYSDSNDVGRKLPNGVLHLGKGSVADGNAGDSPQIFYISGAGQSLKLEASSESEKRQWLTALGRQISPKLHTRRSSAMQNAQSRMCNQCGQCISLDSFTLGSHVGWLTKQGGDIKTWKRRWVVLSKSHMCYYHSEEDVAVFKPIDMFHTVKAARFEQGSKPFMFTVDSGTRVFYFSCKNENDYQEWIQALQIQ